MRPLIKAPLATKWYHLLVHHEGRIEAVQFPDMGDYEDLGSPYVDHVPNPRHVARWAEQQGYDIDEISLELMVGRWELEAGSRYDDLFQD